MGSDSSKPSAFSKQSRTLPPSTSSRFRAISDNFNTLEQVQGALRKEGLESSQLVVAVDFTKSNEWTGKRSFGGQSLHALSPGRMNFYEQAITIIGRTLSAFDDDGLIPCYGFGDTRTQDSNVFSFLPGDAPCEGLHTVCSAYRDLVPAVRMAGPTSFAPAIIQAMRHVVASGGQYHILLIVADGQVTRPSDMLPGQLSTQEQATVNAIMAASELPLSIIMVGVGDGPWDVMKEFDDALPQRRFDNFQFVNFTDIATGPLRNDTQRMEAQFALRALMEVPEQYKLIQKLGLLGSHRAMPFQPAPPLDPPGGAAGYGTVPHGAAGYGGAPPAGAPPMYPSMASQPAPGYAAPPGQQPQALPYPHPFPEPDKPGQAPWGAPNPYAPAQPQFPQFGRPSRLAGDEVNSLFICPITQEVMADPVIAADGQTYDRTAIEAWLATKDTSPMTMVVLPNKNLIPNHALRSAIQEAMQNNPNMVRMSGRLV